MNRAAVRSFPIVVLAFAVGCGGPGPANGTAPTRAATSAPGERAAAFRAPADGRLTPAQAERYLKVLEKVREERNRAEKGPRPTNPEGVLGEPLENTLGDVRAARELFPSAEEYLWVKERVLEAEGAALSAKLDADHAAALQRTLADLRKRRETAADDGSRKLLEEQIATFSAELDRTQRESREKEPEAIRANMKILEPYRERLDGFKEEISRVVPPERTAAAPPR